MRRAKMLTWNREAGHGGRLRIGRCPEPGCEDGTLTWGVTTHNEDPEMLPIVC